MLAVMKLRRRKIDLGENYQGKDRHSPDNGNSQGRDEEHADQQEHRGEGGGQGQQEVEPEPDVLLPEGEGDAVRKVWEAAGYEGRGLAWGILRSLSWGWVDDAIRPV